MNYCILKDIPCLYASKNGFCPFDYCAEEEHWKKRAEEAEGSVNNGKR